jgi:hypothetical protein
MLLMMCIAFSLSLLLSCSLSLSGYWKKGWVAWLGFELTLFLSLSLNMPLMMCLAFSLALSLSLSISLRVLEEKMGRLAWILIKTCTAMQEYMPVRFSLAIRG